MPHEHDAYCTYDGCCPEPDGDNAVEFHNAHVGSYDPAHKHCQGHDCCVCKVEELGYSKPERPEHAACQQRTEAEELGLVNIFTRNA